MEGGAGDGGTCTIATPSYTTKWRSALILSFKTFLQSEGAEYSCWVFVKYIENVLSKFHLACDSCHMIWLNFTFWCLPSIVLNPTNLVVCFCQICQNS